MKKVVGLILFFRLLTACAQSPIETQTIDPPQTQPAKATSQPPVPSPVPTRTFIPATVPFTDQVSMEHAQIVYYDVIGSTADELRESMNELRPKDPYDDNKPVDSYTDWYVSWNWPGYGTATCDLSVASVTYSIRVNIPRWIAPADAPPELIAKWEKYIQNLVVHEKGHVDNIVSNYQSVETAIWSATCSTAEVEAQKALGQLREFDSSYDSDTKHGETQGAVFP